MMEECIIEKNRDIRMSSVPINKSRISLFYMYLWSLISKMVELIHINFKRVGTLNVREFVV